MNPSLAERLRTETRELHTAAERSAFMAALMSGHMTRPAYCLLLSNLHAIYAALEPALERHATNPLIEPVFLPALWRTSALEHDLRALSGADWCEAPTPTPATTSYVARLRELDASQPGLLLAHAYVRYLGDLSGGQMLCRVVAKSETLAGAAAIAFYDFGDALAVRDLTQRFRAGLQSVPVDERMASALVDEARLAFRLHQALFEELAQAR